MSSPGVAGLLRGMSQFFLKLPRRVLVRMARNKASDFNGGVGGKEQGGGCGKWRAWLLVLCVLCGVAVSVWLSSGVRELTLCSGREKVKALLEEKAEAFRVEFNLTMSQLQALASLFSLSDQRVLSKSTEKSVPDMPHSDGLMHAVEVVCSKWTYLQAEQEQVAEIIPKDQCPIQDDYISRKSENSSPKDERMYDMEFQATLPFIPTNGIASLKEHQTTSWIMETLNKKQECHKRRLRTISNFYWWIIVAIMVFLKGCCVHVRSRKSSHQEVQQQQLKIQLHNSMSLGRWRKKLLLLGISLGLLAAVWIFCSMSADINARRKETLAGMCDERARMLQDQFNVSMNHVHALAILVSTFHHGKHPSAIDQRTFAKYTARTAFERPLTSGVAYALRVPHSQREEFEKQHGWKIKKMETEDQSPVQDDYIPEKLDPSPIQDEYAPVIFSQETVSHIVSIDMMSGKEDKDNILRARASGKGVLTSPFKLLKSNHLGVVLTFAVYNTELPPNATPEDRIEATEGYLGASFDVPSLVEKLLHQLASKQTIIVNVYDTTNSSSLIRMYGPDIAGAGEMYISNLDFGDPSRKHEMHCRFKQDSQPPWSAITTSGGVAVIVLLVGHIFYAAINRIEKVEDDYREMKELKFRAEAADVAKSQFLATVSHEIRTPMNGVLGMLQMLMDTNLDATQHDFAVTAQASGKALISLINEVLDQAKIESGRLELEAVHFDVRDALDSVLSIFSDKSQGKGIELAGYISDRVPEVLIGDPGRFRQIITNLVGNSVKFTEEGHIFVSVHLVDEVKISLDDTSVVLGQNLEQTRDDMSMSCDTLSGFHVADRWKSWEKFNVFKVSNESSDVINLLVTVEDTGVGIPQDAQRRIFMPFMQADSSTSRTYGGTGIGLSISKCLVDLMGGEIGFVSKPGIGSTFSFTAMFREGQKNLVDLKRKQSDQDLPDFSGMRGLIVDGRSIRATVTKYHLERLRIRTELVTDSNSALAFILNPRGKVCFDMVLVDKEAWGEGSGLAFPHSLIELRQSIGLKPHEDRPKMFLLATYLSSTEIDDLKSSGYADSIIKPLRIGMISACLQKALGRGNKWNGVRRKPLELQSLLSGKHILVVDDNAVNRKVAAGALKKYGATVTCAEDGRSAVAMLHPPHNFDACFMDVQMPEMDGFETTKRIRCLEGSVNELLKSGETSKDMYGNKAYWHIPILAMTADVFQATHEECARCGMDGYVSKPFEEEQLYSAVAHFLCSDIVDSLS